MRVMYEEWLVRYKVDVVFAGHVHAYERSVSILYSWIIYLLNLIRFHILVSCHTGAYIQHTVQRGEWIVHSYQR